MINYGRQSISQDDIDAVVAVLRGDWLTQGPSVEVFERLVAEYVGAQHAVAFSSGTSALHGAAHAAGLGPGDIVYTSPLTFMASANCIRYVGAQVALVDIDDETLNMRGDLIPPRTDGTIAVHYAGLPMDLNGLRSRSRVVIEDAAHALGAMTPDGPVGNCAHSDMCCFSFHPVKPITTAEGGMVTTNDDDLAERLRRFRSHGMVKRPEIAPWHYDIEEPGYNYRLTDLQAALGSSQMTRIDDFITRRNAIADRYRADLNPAKYRLPAAAPMGWRHGYHLFVVRVSERLRIYEELRQLGIATQVHYVPVHHHTVSNDIDDRNRFPVCDAAYEQILSIPIYPGMSDEDQSKVITALNKVG